MNLKKIVLPEGGDERVLSAAKELIGGAICHPVLIGDVAKIGAFLESSPRFYTVLSEDDTELKGLQATALAKGKQFPVVSAALAQGAALVRDGLADGIVGGAETKTDDVFRVYVKTIGVREDVSRVTACFLLEKGQERYIFADGALNLEYNSEQLAELAQMAAQYAKSVGIEPKIAFLAGQTDDGVFHPTFEWLAQAAELARTKYGLMAEGPVQFDAAMSTEVSALKQKNSIVAGQATVFVFPDHNSGNIGYKIANRWGGFKATGPLFLGFAKPAYDLSRGCTVAEIVSVVNQAVKNAS